MDAGEVEENIASVPASERARAYQLSLGIVEVTGPSRGQSPLIIEDLDVNPLLPRTTGAPTLNP